MASKILDNVVELGKIQYISGNNTLNFTATPIGNGAPIVDATAGIYANGAFLQSNSAFNHANAAFNSANNVAPQIAPAFNQANVSFNHANAAFNSANNVAPQILPAFNQANASFNHANAAFNSANTKLSSSGGSVSGDLAITGNLIVSGSRIEINTATVLLNDNIITINSDLPNNISPTEDSGIEINRGSSANVSILWNETSDAWTFTNDGSSYERIPSGSYANGAFAHANAAFNSANNVAPQVQPAFDTANASFIQANAAFNSANNVAPQVQPAFNTANASFIQANAAFNAANTISLNRIYKNDTSVEVIDANTTNSRIIVTVDANAVTEVSSSNLKINLSTVATSTTTGALQVLGGAGITGNLHVGGTIYAVGDVVSSYSDERLKDKTRDVTEALSIISELNVFYYTANDTARKYTRTDDEEKIGLSAQDVQRVLPSIVSLSAFDTELDDNGNITSKTGQNYLTVDYARIVPILIQAIKEQQKEIDSLKEKINGIYNR